MTPRASMPGGRGKTYPPRVGNVRPSQLMYTYGVGAILDLPNLSVIVAGLDDWSIDDTTVISEARLLDSVRGVLGKQVRQLRSAPWLEETRSPFDEWAWVGVPVLPFPRWMRCSACQLLTHVDAGLFDLRLAYRPDKTAFVHTHCASKRGRPPTAIPTRVVAACRGGHVDDFPWAELCHRATGGACPAGDFRLQLRDTAGGARSTDMIVRCDACHASARLMRAFGQSGREIMPRCRGRHPHLHTFDERCPYQLEAILLGASNQWFAVTRSALALPVEQAPLASAVAAAWDTIDARAAPVSSPEMLRFAVQQVPDLRPLADHDLDAVWRAIEERRHGPDGDERSEDLLSPEWEVLRSPERSPQGEDFLAGASEALPAFPGIASVLDVQRLRVVSALCGFTRLDAPEFDVAEDAAVACSPMARKSVTWVPAGESRGEGIFLRFDEASLRAWEDRVAGREPLEALRDSTRRWRQRRNLDGATGWPGARYVLLHSLSHALINELALECGYAAASIRERLYARDDHHGDPMAGILLYTAAPDSEGTLGGLVAMAQPARFAPLIDQALRRMSLCSSDPLCSTHRPSAEDVSLHAAACHACLFVPETSCEWGNRYLDRGVLAVTIGHTGVAYPFRG